MVEVFYLECTCRYACVYVVCVCVCVCVQAYDFFQCLDTCGMSANFWFACIYSYIQYSCFCAYKCINHKNFAFLKYLL